LIATMGFSFGLCRVTSATLVLYGQNDPRTTSRRVSYYNTLLTFGQVISPWVSGWVAAILGITFALTVVPSLMLAIYLGCIMILPKIFEYKMMFQESEKI
jgi:hypothetical protein